MRKTLYRIREVDSDFTDVYFCGNDEEAILFFYAYVDYPESFGSNECDYTLEKYGYTDLATRGFHPFAEPIKMI